MMKTKLIIVFAIVTLLNACVTDPAGPYGDSDLKAASRINAKLGLGYMMQGNNELALTKLKKALKEDDSDEDAHLYMAELYKRLDEEDRADKHYNRALEILPTSVPILNNYGVFLCRYHHYEKSMAIFKKLLKNPLFKTKSHTYENMGLCASQQGNTKLAEDYFRKALRFNGRLPESLIHLAQISFDNQSFLSAYGFYQRYIEVGKQTPQSLWLGILLEKHNGNKNALASYSLLLKNMFPASKEAEFLKRMEARDGDSNE